jgi:beta-lactamase class A
LKGFNGDVGVYVHDLKKNRVVCYHADTVFPTASMVKVPILTGIMRKIESGELQYHQTLTYKDSLLYAGVDILGSLKNNEKIELSK